MPIIQYAKGDQPYFEFLSAFPDQYVSQKEKEKDDWIQHNMDFFSIQAYRQFINNKESWVKNYDLVKGFLRKEDFYEVPEVVSFMETIKENELPDHVKNYSIMAPVLNTLRGEQGKRPDGFRVKAMDDNSQSEELTFRTNLLKQLVLQTATQRIYEQMASQGIDPAQIPQDQVQQLSAEAVEEMVDNYTSTAENWANHILEAFKVQYNLKEASEEALVDLLTGGREFYHIQETSENTTGLDIGSENPKNVWLMTTPDQKYSKKAYVIGTIHVMEMSEILEKFPKLTLEEINHLREFSEQFAPWGAQRSNLDSELTGQETIKYNTYDPLVERTREFMQAYLDVDGTNPLDDIFGYARNNASFGNKFSVIRAYWKSKIKVGKLTIWNEEIQDEEVILVDENYKNNSHPNQIGKVEWGWMNQWYYGYKIGPDIYYVEPYKLLPYAPIIGVMYDNKNSPVRSLVDLMKPFQMIFNVCINRLWKTMEKDMGVLYGVQIRRLITPKDGDDQDAIDYFKTMAGEEGLAVEDDSPENTKVPLSNTQVSKAIDLTRDKEVAYLINTSEWARNMCYSLVGMSPERQGSVAATQTATGINASLTQSYAQTEPYFVQHEYVLNQLYQAIIDAAQYIESNKPMSSIPYINGVGEAAFIQINGSDLKMADLKVFVTNRSKDQEAFQAIKNLSQAALQNGASLYDVAEIYTTDSIRKVKHVYKALKEQQEQIIAQQQQMEQQQLQMQQEQFQITLQVQEQARQEQMINENYQRELDRLVKIETALIQASSREGSETQQDSDNNGVPDILEVSRFAAEQNSAAQTYNLELQRIGTEKIKLAQDKDMQLQQLKLEQKKIEQKDREMKTKERIEKIKLKNPSPGEKKSKK